MKLCGRLLTFASILLVVCLLAIGTGWAQDAAIEGVVTDPSEAVIPGAEITVTNLDTTIARTTLTGEDGFYSVPLLKEGTYRVSCGFAGFHTQQTEILLDLGQVATVDFQLQVGLTTEVIEVRASASRIQTKAQDVGAVIEEKQIHELPLNGRNYLTLAHLSPGILKGAQGGRGQTNAAEEGGFRSGGLPMDQTAILVDGMDNAARPARGPVGGQTQTMKPAVEAISEFKVITNNVSAEYGYKAGAQVLVSTKSGSNSFHGSLYNFHRNGATTANNFMFNRDAPRDPDTNEITEPKPPYVRNQFGGTIGGPIIKNRTFFFFSFQGTRRRENGQGPFTASVPSLPARQGDFSQELNIPKGKPDIYDPLTLTNPGGTSQAERQPFPNHILPQDRWDPVAVAFLEMFPLPNRPGHEFEYDNYFRVKPYSKDGENYDGRIDHNFNDSHRIFGRWSYRNENGVNGQVLPFPAKPSNIAFLTGHQLAINYNATLGPMKHNELRFGLTHFPSTRLDEHTENLNHKFGIKNGAADQYPELMPDGFHNGAASMVFGRYAGLGGSIGRITNTQTNQYLADNFLIDLGSHSLKFGGEYRRVRSNRTQGFFPTFGRFKFDGRYTAQFPNVPGSRANTGNSLADAMLGWTWSTLNGLPEGEDVVSPYWGFYLQDDWRVSPRLTVNFGLRWELFGRPRSVDLSPSNKVAAPIFTGNTTDETLDILDIRFDHWKFPEREGDCGCILDKNNWAPRIGIAYRLTNDTVIRVGGGLYYSEIGFTAEQSNRFHWGGPNITSLETREGYETTHVFVKGGFPLFEVKQGDPTFLAGQGAFIVPEFLPTTSSGQWFLDIQHQLPWDVLVTLGYNGQAQSHLPWTWRNTAVPLEPGTSPWFNKKRLRTPPPADMNSGPLPVLYLMHNESILNANYNAFTAKVEKRFSQGLSFLSSFTWSKTLDYQMSSATEHVEGAVNPPSPHLKYLRLNYGRSALSRDFAYSLSVLYELPAGPGKGCFHSGPASWFLGGWQLGGIYSYQSGPWISHNFWPNYANTGGPYRADLVGEINLPESERDSMRWFDATAIEAGPEAEFGNAGRSLIEGAGWKNLDFLLSKNFYLPWEGHRIQFRFEAFNFTNTPHLGGPQSNTNRGYGSQLTINQNSPENAAIIRFADDPRIIQFALKYVF